MPMALLDNCTFYNTHYSIFICSFTELFDLIYGVCHILMSWMIDIRIWQIIQDTYQLHMYTAICLTFIHFCLLFGFS